MECSLHVSCYADICLRCNSFHISQELKATNPKYIYCNVYMGMKFFLRIKIDEVTEEHAYHCVIAIYTPMNWCDPRLSDIMKVT
jgi:hypothetical protein